MIDITWLGHATYTLRLKTGEVVLVDPWIDGNPSYPEGYKLDRVDIILVTHAHGDHIGNLVAIAKEFSPKVVAIYETAVWLEKKGVQNVIGMNKGGTAQVGPISVTMTHAIHSNSITEEDGTVVYAGEPAGYVVRLADRRVIYCAGDTGVFSDMQLIARLYHPELAFLPIGDFYTMGPREAALAVQMLDVRKVIPVHWGTFPALTGQPKAVADLLRDHPSNEVWALEPGKTVQW
ncbi:MAG: metal-dependent hydrolase [Acidobacteriota bacterium]